jgi:predicted enzyme related to lactoylglutathione lyase
MEEDMSKQGEFNHIELPADDVARAQQFYGAVFGWQFRSVEGMDDYVVYTAGPAELGGGIGVRGKTAPDAVRNYLAVDSIADTIAAATANGGSVVVPETDIGFGWYAAISDSEGNELGLYKAKSEG